MDVERFFKYLVVFGVFVGSFAEVRGSRIRTRYLFPKNFISLRYNTHGEKELRIAYNNILSLETTLSLSKHSDLVVVMRQITDGRKLVQSVYQGGDIKECDHSKDPAQILDFVADFILPDIFSYDEQFGDVFQSYGLTNVSYNQDVALEYFKRRDVLKEFTSMVDMRYSLRQCRSFYKRAKRHAKSESMESQKQDRPVNQDKTSNTENDKSERFNVIPVSDDTQNGLAKHRISKRSSDPVKKSRSKRSAFDFNSVLIFPGTKWCGKGDLAQCYDDLGDDQELDVCCRDHDCCPYMIPPFSSRFNMFNYRFHSLIHCDCDNSVLQEKKTTVDQAVILFISLYKMGTSLNGKNLLPEGANSFLEEQFLMEYYQSVKLFGSISSPTFVGPDLGSNCLQRLSADDTSRFRGCLRQSLSTTANMIGKIYFNILGSKCFSFEDQEVCVERSWWGRCRKYEQQATAILQSQGSFHDDHDVISNHIDNNS